MAAVPMDASRHGAAARDAASSCALNAYYRRAGRSVQALVAAVACPRLVEDGGKRFLNPTARAGRTYC